MALITLTNLYNIIHLTLFQQNYDDSHWYKTSSSCRCQLYPLSQTYILTYLCLFARWEHIGHRLRNATVFCPWPSSPFLSWCIPSPSFLFPCLFARCFVAYLFVSSLGGSMWWLDGWWCLVVSWVYVLSTSIFSSLFHFLWVVAWSFSRV